MPFVPLQTLLRSRARHRQRRRRARLLDAALERRYAPVVVNDRAWKERRGYITRWGRPGRRYESVYDREWGALSVIPYTPPRLRIVENGRPVGYRFIRDRDDYRVAHRAAIDRYLSRRSMRRARHDLEL
jgi:hypothetical protein